jgi:hypothetical protein
MRSKFVSVFVGVGVGILGAVYLAVIPFPFPPKPDVDPKPVVGPKPVVDPKPIVDPRTGEISTRWIGLRSVSSRECPVVKGWKGEPLLSKAATSPEDLALIHHAGLDRFCVYTPEAGSSQAFVAPPGLTASMDRLAISTAGAEEELMSGSPLANPSTLDSVGNALATEFLGQTGQVPGLTPGPPNVQITVLDSEPDDRSLPGPADPSLEHGFAVAQLARELVCNGSSGPCAATVVNKRVLNYNDSGSTLTPVLASAPGSVGLISELACAIIKAASSCPRGKHLILNLSIGWDGEQDLKGVKDPSCLDATTGLVYQALQLAAEKQVLVIAAAGNRRGGSVADSNWPVLPAAWDLWPSGKQSNLIYAVGGVDWHGLPLPNARTNGLPVRVAYGDHATVEVNGKYTTVYTGSSVSTAVVSATAAAIWNLLPQLQPAEVMALIDGSGKAQRVSADYHPGSPAQPIKEVFLGTAVQYACRTKGGCPIASKALEFGIPRHQPPVLSSLLTEDEPNPSFGNAFARTGLPPTPPTCNPSTVLLTVGDPVPPAICPTDQYTSISSQQWISPQPGDDPCPNCTLVPTGPPHEMIDEVTEPASSKKASVVPKVSQLYQLAISLSPSWITAHPNVKFGSAAMLDIDCFRKHPGMAEKMTRMTYPVEITPSTGPAAQNSQAWTMFRLGDGHPLGLCRAQLNFLVTDNYGTWSIQNPVVVDPKFRGATGVAEVPAGSSPRIGASSSSVVTATRKEKSKATSPSF